MGAPQELIAGRYRLERRIAADGMGVVWEARDELLRRTVAVKQLRTTAGVPEDEADLAKQRAMREARITARLHHQHAVPVFDSVEHDGEPCLVMQYVPSEPLSAVIKRRGGLPVAEVARIGAEVADALAAAHALGIVHRDVKPGNILIADVDGSAMLSDFGISHALGDATLTSTGFMHGTPAYLAPEVARGDESTFASDVFSLGSTLYAASEGRPPFGEEPNSIAVLHRVAVGGFQAPTDSGPLGPLLLQMMASEPDDRPTMQEVARRLAALHADLGEELVPTLPLAAREQAAEDDPDQPTAWVPVEHDAPATLVAEAVATPEDTPAAEEPAPADTASHPTGPRAATAPVPRSAPPPPAEAGDAGNGGSDDRPRRRRAVVIGVLVAVVLLAALAVGLLLLIRPGAPSTGIRSPAAGPSASTSAPAASPSATPSASTPSPTPSTPSPPPSSSSPAPTPSSTPSTSSGNGTATSPVAAIERYYTLVPGNTDAAWPLMTADYQQNHAGGRAAYDEFWAQVRSIRATNVRQIGPDQVEATLTYTRASGVEVDDTTFRLVREGGVLKIADSAVR
ncbi:serine/threonine-protein kinase [Amnibacterium kyonggiense]|uniref:non-specific serine/threonine protein kinase n=1 Tax=Amnibacterium kyonggiense TaxID=595671 RepID=A0A4R7FLF9_9MICO|nr:serine/threonine-protein kinase [Amnibacterium kyonggiense]TDS77216.1 serine/threonine protein kinase [Amnibacterium kyonggiense]